MKGQRVALVVGGAGGMGARISAALAERYRVAVADLDADAAGAVAAGVGGWGVGMDVCDAASVADGVAAVGERLGSPLVVVNCAGWDEFKPFLDTDEAFTAKVLEINLAGPIRVLRATLPGMVEAGWGRIVSVASDAGRVGSPLESVYSAAKGGLIAFTKTIAREFARHGITANSLCPGPADTPLLQRIVGEGEDSKRMVEALTKAVPMRRLATPEDIAPAVAFLASEEAGYITGQTLSVSGGLTMC